MAVETPILEVEGISKAFPGVQALKDVSIAILPGEVHALVGENGAGKSTLIKILAGAIKADTGVIRIRGRQVTIDSPQHAQALGISIIHQELNLVPYLTVAANIYLGREPRRGARGAFIDEKTMHERASALLRELGVELDPGEQVGRLSVARQQIVEIAKALSFNAAVIAMDEPTSALTHAEQERLFGIVRKLKSSGVSVLYISHRMEEIFELADRVTVMRDGQVVGTAPISAVSRADLIRMMVGREVAQDYPRPAPPSREEILRVEGLTRRGVVEDASLTLHKGEILGITGLVGAGRTELARMIFGADPADSGTIYLEGRPVVIRSPSDAIRLGIALLTEDRKRQGLVLGMPVYANVSLATLPSFVRRWFVDEGSEREAAQRYVEELRIKTPSLNQAVGNLSGGNQQKTVLARWLLSRARVLIFDEPTRGIDVGAKMEVYLLMKRLAEEGYGIIMISSELPEVLGMSHRVLVMYKGRIQAELTPQQATAEAVMHYATGGS